MFDNLIFKFNQFYYEKKLNKYIFIYRIYI